MSKIKNGGLDQYGAKPFERQWFGTAGVEGGNNWIKSHVNTDGLIQSKTLPTNCTCNKFDWRMHQQWKNVLILRGHERQLQLRDFTHSRGVTVADTSADVCRSADMLMLVLSVSELPGTAEPLSLQSASTAYINTHTSEHVCRLQLGLLWASKLPAENFWTFIPIFLSGNLLITYVNQLFPSPTLQSDAVI